MGIWGRLKQAFGSFDDGEPTEPDREAAPEADAPPPEPRTLSEPSVAPQIELHRQSAATKHFYEAEKRRAQAAGQTVKGFRAGYIATEEAKARLVAGPDGLPPLKLVGSTNGLDFSFPDGKLVDYNLLALRQFNIFAFRVVGMAYYEDPAKPFRFRNGQRVAARREPDNEHDANAVAITFGRPERKIGYVNKQRAKWVAELLDGGQKLEGLVIQSKVSSPRVLVTTPEMLAHLRR